MKFIGRAEGSPNRKNEAAIESNYVIEKKRYTATISIKGSIIRW